MTIPHRWSGSVAIVTGAGSGIGRAAALAFARRGARVVATDIVAERARGTRELVEAAGGVAIDRTADVSNQDDVVGLRVAALEAFGRVDVVMNNVGIIAMGAPESLPIEAWERSLDVNVVSIARSNAVFLPLLLAQGTGHVINTASASGLLAYGFDRLPYVASKHAVVGLTEALAIYLGARGVGVTLVCPSGVVTNIVEQITSYGDGARPRAPQHRLAQPSEVGESIADAVEDGRYLVVTADELHDELRERAGDVERYIGRMIQAQRGSEP